MKVNEAAAIPPHNYEIWEVFCSCARKTMIIALQSYLTILLCWYPVCMHQSKRLSQLVYANILVINHSDVTEAIAKRLCDRLDTYELITFKPQLNYVRSCDATYLLVQMVQLHEQYEIL